MYAIAVGDDRLWAAIAEPSRRRLIDVLSLQGSLSASKLAEYVPFSRQAVAKHLAVLCKVGMVGQHKQGKEVLFAIQPEGLQRAAQAMHRAANQWDQRLVRIKAIAEQLEQLR